MVSEHKGTKAQRYEKKTHKFFTEKETGSKKIEEQKLRVDIIFLSVSRGLISIRHHGGPLGVRYTEAHPVLHSPCCPLGRARSLRGL